MNEASVYQLITKLCSSLIKESEDSAEGFSLNSAKSIAFKVLLQNNNCVEIPEDEDLLQELQFASFELSLANRNKDSKDVNQFIERFKEKPKGLESISWLLVHLKNIDPEGVNHKVIN
jgi:hypothetical protein